MSSKNKILIAIGSLFIVLSISIFIMNRRYPFFIEQSGGWSVGFNTQKNILSGININKENLLLADQTDAPGLSKSKFIADPFFLKEGKNTYLFVENLREDSGNGNIDLFISFNDKDYKYMGEVLDEPFHISYPQVFKHKDRYFMVPETKRSNNILLYEAKNFPYDWVIVDTLIHNVRYKDPSIYLSDSLNFLVTVDDEMWGHVYRSSSLFGDWIKQENHVRWGNETRPGGRIFNVNNDLFIPFQNYSKGYGTGISLYKIVLDKKHDINFEKFIHFYLHPHDEIYWFNKGMHHIDIKKIDDTYYIFYDGDRKSGNIKFRYRSTFKKILMDLYQFFLN